MPEMTKKLKKREKLHGDADFKPITVFSKCQIDVRKDRWFRPRKDTPCVTLDCNMLESLYISHSKEKDLKFLEKLSRLKSLTISQSTIHSLVGLEKLKMLTKLELIHLKTLSTFGQLNDCSNLEELSIHRCSKFKDVAVLSELAKLRKLTIDIRGNIPSISKLISLPSLANIDLGGSTIVDDGDIECLLKFLSLKFVNFRNRKHYNVTRGEFYKRRWPNQAWTNQFD